MAIQLLETINKLDLKKEFAPKILNRGKDYYLDNSVRNVQFVDENTIIGTVYGSASYQTYLHYQNGKIDFQCTCPYEYKCKHVVALLLYVKNNRDQLLGQAILPTNQESSSVGINPCEKLLKELQRMIAPLNYVTSYLETRFSNKLNEYIQAVESLIEKKNPHASKALVSLFSFITKIQTQGEDTSLIDESFSSIAKTFIKLIYLEQKDTLSELFKLINEKKQEVLARFLIDVANKITSLEETKLFLPYLEEYVKGVSTNNLFNEVGYEKTEVSMVETIDRLVTKYFSPQDILAYYRKNAGINIYFGQMLMKHLRSQKLFDEAITYYQNLNNQNIPLGIAIIYCALLYEKGNKAKAYYLAIEIFKNIPSLKSYEELKAVFTPADFKEIATSLSEIAKESGKDDCYLQICFKENQLDEAFKVCKEEGMDLMMKYFESFLPRFNDELLQIYQKELFDHLPKCNRWDSKFEYYYKMLQQMEKMRNGKYFIFAIVNYVFESSYSYNRIVSELMFFARRLKY